MREEIIVSGRDNYLIDPHLQIWHWQIPLYLFLGGMAAGILFFAAFFTLMYIPPEEHLLVLKEAWRVLGPAGKLLVWEAALPTSQDQPSDYVAFYIDIQLPDREVQTGYGTKWPSIELDLSYYQNLAKQAGFDILRFESQPDGKVFFLELQKLEKSV